VSAACRPRRIYRRLHHAAFASLLLLGAARAPAQPAGDRIATDLREEVHHIEVTAKDLYSRQETATIAVTAFRPPGDGPFPLAIVSHGRGGPEQRAGLGRQRFELLARYLVTKGFAVFVPNRIGYGETARLGFDPEDSGPCQAKRFEPMAQAASDQVLATLAYARSQPWADSKRWVALGQSVGGLTTLAVASRRPSGLVAAVNFSGGAGGDPDRRPAEPCGPDQLARLWRSQGAAAGELPTLWIYWTHDRYWGEQHPVRWAEAWREGGGQAQLHQLLPWGSEPTDGHTGLTRDMDSWAPLVERFLVGVGFDKPGLPSRPAPTAFARLDEADKVPVNGSRRELLYRRFLAARAPRAFAIGPDGDAAWASGDWAIGRALGACQWRNGQTCRLYAVDDEVVWVPFSKD
jgi:dienelactone hydrolase